MIACENILFEKYLYMRMKKYTKKKINREVQKIKYKENKRSA